MWRFRNPFIKSPAPSRSPPGGLHGRKSHVAEAAAGLPTRAGRRRHRRRRRRLLCRRCLLCHRPRLLTTKYAAGRPCLVRPALPCKAGLAGYRLHECELAGGVGRSAHVALQIGLAVHGSAVKRQIWRPKCAEHEHEHAPGSWWRPRLLQHNARRSPRPRGSSPVAQSGDALEVRLSSSVG